LQRNGNMPAHYLACFALVSAFYHLPPHVLPERQTIRHGQAPSRPRCGNALHWKDIARPGGARCQAALTAQLVSLLNRWLKNDLGSGGVLGERKISSLDNSARAAAIISSAAAI
jgi:hypothetical protein